MHAMLRSIPSRFPSLPQLGFEIEMPADFAEPPIPEETPKFEQPAFMMPLWLSSAQVALALLAVSARPAYDDGSVIEWVQFLAHDQGLTLLNCAQRMLGPHPAIVFDASQEQDGVMLRFHMAAVQDGDMLFVIMAMTPEALWPSFGEQLSAAIASFRLMHPAGPRAPLTPAASPRPEIM
ncbi:MAG: hypothetical protein KF866_02665 [Phycisphaeraceae bacterium]|nr:hypothetical protein [Phycisphaeraceae bacterium]MCW5753401.1 hypothetical protein [Phycisphaeraceae bacterium]